MSGELRKDYSDICSLISNEISRCELRIKQTEENLQRANNLQGQRDTYEKSIRYCDITNDSLKPLIADIQKYIEDKRKNSRMALNNALRLAGEIIPASMKGIKFQVEGDEAWLEMPNGAYVDRCEGSGYKGTTSVFLRSIVLAQNSENLQTLILDEPLAKLSDERTALLSRYLPQLVKNQQVILIEQKKEVYANCDATLYKFHKSGEFTTVTREETEHAEVS